MKASVGSIRRPLLRALYALLLGITALWAMPRSTPAQIYVGQVGTDTVGEYNAAEPIQFRPYSVWFSLEVLNIRNGYGYSNASRTGLVR